MYFKSYFLALIITRVGGGHTSLPLILMSRNEKLAHTNENVSQQAEKFKKCLSRKVENIGGLLGV